MKREKYYWLNDDSITFLKRGYLLEGEDAKQRYRQIAENAETILNLKGFADKFEEYNALGYYSLSSPIISNFGRGRGLSISCVTGDTWINTKVGGGKQAKDIIVGDEVLTHKGRYRKVINVIPTKNKGDIYKLKVANRMTPLYITGNHLVLTNFGWVRIDELSIEKHLIAINGDVEFSETEHTLDLKEDGLFYAPIKQLELTDKVEDVYDFTVEEDHSFSAAGVVLHNCFGSYIPDTMNGIMDKASEVAIMTKHGGGTSAYFGDVRGRGSSISTGGASTGAVHFMEIYDKLMHVVSQGNVRRGSFAAYLPIDHGDVEEFLKIKSEGASIQDTSIGLCISDEWMKSMLDGDKSKRKIWADVIKKRFESGYPYLFFSDNANNQAPQVYRDLGMKILASNLCNEIMLPSSENESFVCDLASMNLENYDEWKDTDAVETMIFFLDAVMSEFISKTENDKHMQSPRNFAINHRALGLGVLGWHSLLQKRNIAFESMQAKFLNSEIWKNIRSKADQATKKLAELYGEPPILKGYGKRNTTTLAVAPTTSSSFILGQISPSIEPLNSNYYVRDLAKGKFTYRNPYLKSLLQSKDMDTDDVWKDILIHGGSVQHLTFLSQEEKDVFKTFGEISQKEIIIQAAQRQKWIDQGQSLNLMIPPNTKPKDVNELIVFAWQQGIKGLYYQRSANPAQELARSILTCKSCEA